MSQSATYVQALDGLLYKDPIISGEDWFVCFDDDEPPEIVMKRFGSTTEKSARRKAHLLLMEAGIGFTLGEINSLTMGRSFPPTWKAKPASSIFFTLLAPIPIPRTYGGVKIKPAAIDASMYIFWHDFDTRAVVESILGLELDTLLLKSQNLWEGSVFKIQALASMLRREILKQLPQLKDVTVENYEAYLAEGPPKLRVKWSSSNATVDSGS